VIVFFVKIKIIKGILFAIPNLKVNMQGGIIK